MSFLSTKHASKPVMARAARHFCFVLVDAGKGCTRDQIARRKRKRPLLTKGKCCSGFNLN